MNTFRTDALAGVLQLFPGLCRPHNLCSTRRDWAALLTRGVSASALPTRLSSLYSLCGHSHRLCADMAVAAALTGQTGEVAASALRSLQQETLREQVRRVTLDWPRQLGAGVSVTSARTALLQCPLFITASTVSVQTTLPDWLSAHLLGMPAVQWLDAWERDPAAWLRSWCESTDLWLPGMLKSLSNTAVEQVYSAQCATVLGVHACATELMALADTLRQDTDFTRHPLWRGACAETGPWTRLNQAQPETFNTPLLRLGSRLAELVRLALPDHPERSGAQWLRMGSLATAPREGLAWVEMARGLLIHHVQLEGEGKAAHVKSCHVLAPTEWNFHPDGAVAQVLEQWPADHADLARHVNLLVCAYDPCVKHEIILASTLSQEPAHA